MPVGWREFQQNREREKVLLSWKGGVPPCLLSLPNSTCMKRVRPSKSENVRVQRRRRSAMTAISAGGLKRYASSTKKRSLKK